jgi:BolA protein
MKQRIETKLTAAFSPTLLVVTDESHKHAGHAGARPGGETHYHVRMETPAFNGLSRVKRHQAVYALLAQEFAGTLHALSLDLHESK